MCILYKSFKKYYITPWEQICLEQKSKVSSFGPRSILIVDKTCMVHTGILHIGTPYAGILVNTNGRPNRKKRMMRRGEGSRKRRTNIGRGGGGEVKKQKKIERGNG